MEGELDSSTSAGLPSSLPSAWKGACLGALIAALLHAHLLATPFWQDDFAAIQRALDNPAFISSLVPEKGGTFLRPIGVGVWWWLATRWGEPASWVVHAVKLGLFTAMVTCVGVLSAWAAGRWLRDADGVNARKRAFWAALLYGAHNAFFLPVAWGSGAQEILGLFFSSLSLLAWMAWGTDAGKTNLVYLISAMFAQVLAHGSKEGTVALAVAVPTFLVLGRTRWPRVLAATLITVVLADLWLEFRGGYVAPPGPGSPYEYLFGMNMIRNAGALLAFAGGLPREAVQLFVVHRDPWALAWGVACLLLFSGGAVLVLRGLFERRSAALFAAPLLMFGLSLAPYVPLRWNCYPYYALFGLMAWPVAVALAWGEGRRLRAAGALVIASTLYCALGEHWAPPPAPLARAQRIASVRESLRQSLRSYPPDMPLFLAGNEDSDLYVGMGWRQGLRLARRASSSHLVQPIFDIPADFHPDWRFVAWTPNRTLASSLRWPAGTVQGRPAPPLRGVLYFRESGVDFGNIADPEQLRTIWRHLPDGPKDFPERLARPLATNLSDRGRTAKVPAR